MARVACGVVDYHASKEKTKLKKYIYKKRGW